MLFLIINSIPARGVIFSHSHVILMFPLSSNSHVKRERPSIPSTYTLTDFVFPISLINLKIFDLDRCGIFRPSVDVCSA